MDLGDLLKRNRELFGKMKELAIEQEKLASEDDMKKFLRVANKRKNIKKEISRNSSQYRSSIKEKSRSSSTNNAITSEITDVIHSIQEVDKRVEKLVLEKKENILTAAKRLKKGKVAVRGYGSKNPTTPRFINKKG